MADGRWQGWTERGLSQEELACEAGDSGMSEGSGVERVLDYRSWAVSVAGTESSQAER